MIIIEGDLLEGGGQIVRTSIALAALLNKEIKIVNIRGKRSPPGLKAQHIAGIKAVATISKAYVEGLKEGSRELIFKPSTRESGEFHFDVGTAGSISLVLQALMPAAAFSLGEMKISITGGTDVKWAPTIDYIRFVVLPILKLMDYNAYLTVERRGHYPKGGGKITIIIKPVKQLNSLTLTDRGEIKEIYGLSHCTKLPKHIAERQAKSAEERLRKEGFENIKIDLEWYQPEKDFHLGPGSGITLCAKTSSGTVLGSDSIGENGKPAEQVGKEVAENLIKEINSKAALDKHMGDIIIPYLAVANGFSEVTISKITLHTLTNVKITELIAGVKFNIQGDLGSSGKISVKGIGLT
ncbi:MAG: RNA 3'-terminal phosphate cyclase, partial [Candidatus Bathyarchaeia archaeon]